MDFEGYCVKCCEKRQIKGGTVEVTDKGSPVAPSPITRFEQTVKHARHKRGR